MSFFLYEELTDERLFTKLQAIKHPLFDFLIKAWTVKMIGGWTQRDFEFVDVLAYIIYPLLLLRKTKQTKTKH